MAGQVLGTVKSAQGVVDVRSADGKIRSLLVGDQLREGDTVLTTGGGKLVIALSEGGELVLGPGEAVVMTAELSADRFPGAQESEVASVDNILAALQEGKDLNSLLEATAAGPAGGPGTNEGHTFVQLLRVVENVGEVGFQTSAPVESRAPDIEPIYLIPEEQNNPPSVVLGPGDTDDIADEAGLPDGTGNDPTSVNAGGQFQVSDPDGLDDIETITITYTNAQGEQTSVTIPIADLQGTVLETNAGELTITGYDPQTGIAVYEYVLTNPTTDGPGPETDDFIITVSDGEQSSPPAVISIEIIDDEPVANPDVNTVDDGVANGNVSPNDVQGADGGTIVGVATGSNTGNPVTGSIGSEISGTFGKLTLNADGSYSYVLNADNPVVDALDDGESVTDSFVYTIQDGDGDTSTTTLKITINGTNDVPTITTDSGNPQGANDVVNESGLPTGSSPNVAATQASGTFKLTDGDGLDDIKTVTINGTEIQIGSLFNSEIAGEHGTIKITGYNAATGEGTYTYTLTSATTDGDGPETDSFELTTSDGTVSSAPAQIVIEIIDDVPIARDDADSVSEATLVADGNVVTGSGGGDANGSDGTADTAGADGVGGVTWADAQVIDDATIVIGQHGILIVQADGSYRYELNPGDVMVQGLGEGDTLTENFAYSLTDGDGDSDPATLTITINGSNDGVTVTGIGNTAGDEIVNENDLPNGSSPDAGALTQTGTFGITALDGIGSVNIGGTSISFAALAASGTTPITIDTAHGALTINGYTGGLQGGTVNYSYTLDTTVDNDSEAGATGAGYVESLAVTVTDTDGSVGNSSLNIAIVDDVPTANADGPANVVEDGVGNVGGNVLSNDTSGADSAAAFVSWSGGDAATIAALNTYGTLVQNGDGSWTYVLDNSRPATQALTAAFDQNFVLNYTMKDADGDTSSSTLTINIKGANDGATVTTQVAGSAPDATVFESGLNPNGSNAGATTETTTGSFTVSASDGILNVVIGGTVFTLAQVQAFNGTQTVNTGQGVLTLTGYSGTANSGTISYSYTLSATIDNDSVVASGNDVNTATHFDDSVLLTVNGTGGTSGSDNLVIRIVDDTPTANPDGPANVVEDGVGNVSGNVLTNDTSGADTAAAFVSWSGGDAATIAALNTYGTLVQNGDGTWSYTLDNSKPATQALTSAFNQNFVLNYTMKDADGDTSTSTLTINIKGANDSATVTTQAAGSAPDATVFESGLNPNGSNAGATTETTTGSFTVSATDGIATVVIGGTVFTLAQVQAFNGTQTVNTGQGVLTLTGYTGNAQGGTINYSYTLSATIDNDSVVPTGNDAVTAAHFDDSVTLTVNGIGGASGSDNLVIRAIDDVPTATADVNSVTEGASVGGNVLSNDKFGADLGSIQGVVAGTNTANPVSGNVGTQIDGTYGKLTLNANGTYTYVANPNSVAPAGATDTFVYTIVDGDADTSTTTLTITVGDSGLAATHDNVVVDEAALATGTNPSSPNEVATGTLVGNATGGLPGYTYSLVGSGTGSYGTLVLLPAGGYTYTLTKPYDTTPSANNGLNVEDNKDVFTFQVTDANGNTTTGQITVDITDDRPVIDVTNGIAVNAVGTTLVGSIADIGADTNGAALSFNGVQTPPANLTSGGQAVTYSVAANVLTATAGGQTVFTLTLNPDGTYVYDQVRQLDLFQLDSLFQAGVDAGGPNPSYYSFSDSSFGSNPAGKEWTVQFSSAGSVNPSTPGMGVGNNHLDTGETIRIDVDDDAVSGARDLASILTVGVSDLGAGEVLNFSYKVADALGNTLKDGSNNDVVFTGQITSANLVSGVYTFNAPAGYFIDYVDITGGANADVRITAVNAGFVNDNVTRTLNFNVTATDGDGDLVNTPLSILVQNQNTITGTAGNDALGGGDAASTISGGAGHDYIMGGGGNDSLTGGAGSDTFIWRLADKGTAGTPAVDTVADFGTGGVSDVLDLRDLLQGENKADLSNMDNYLHFTVSGGNTTVHISSSGGYSGGFSAGATDQQIQLTGVDLTSIGNDQQIIQNLLTNGKLVTD
ncbi:MAG: hypothetical protein K0Q76_672 [Panacagrimonas sp.]|nr:retention module-containing protein [Panacagrimonas sp.]MCC2655564.1 hypothetical protein [Panacagrimonas sp.]